MSDKIHTLYRFFDVQGVLGYVGRTGHPDRRPQAHREREFWESSHTITLERFDGEASLRAAELRAIHTEHPLFNVASNPSALPNRKRIKSAPQRRKPESGEQCIQKRLRVIGHPETEAYIRVPKDFPGSYYCTGQKATRGIRTVILPAWREALGYGPKTVSVSLRNALTAWGEYKKTRAV